MSSPLGAVITNIFIGKFKDKLFEMTPKLKYYV